MEDKEMLSPKDDFEEKEIDDTESSKHLDEIEDENEDEFKDEGMQILEEVVEDISYLYKDEEDVLANEKLKIKHRIFQIGIVALLFILAIFIIGGARMAMYQTTEVVNNQLVYKQSFATTTKDAYNFAIKYADEYDKLVYLSTIKNEMDLNDAKAKVDEYNTLVRDLDIGKIEDENYEIYLKQLGTVYGYIVTSINNYDITKSSYDEQSETFKTAITKLCNKASNNDAMDNLIKSVEALDGYAQKILK